MYSQLHIDKSRGDFTYIVYKHVSVIRVLVILGVSGDGEFMTSTDGPLTNMMSLVHPHFQGSDVHLCHPSSGRYEFQGLSVNRIAV